MNDYELFERVSDLEKKYMFLLSDPTPHLDKIMSLLKDYNELVADIVEPKMAETREKLYAQQFRDGKISWEQLKEKLNITTNVEARPNKAPAIPTIERKL